MPQNYLNVLKKTENENTAKKTKTTKTIHGIEKQTTKETADQIQQGIAKEILRFHVLANSDSEEDQKLKLEVKDRLVDYMKDILDGAEDVKETKKRITENRETICLVAGNPETGLYLSGECKSGKVLFSDENLWGLHLSGRNL